MMEISDGLPKDFAQLQLLLSPYIKPRQEVCYIRRILAIHLQTQISPSSGHPRPAILALPNDSFIIRNSHGSIRGLRKEYLRSLRASAKARHEYDILADNVGLLNIGDLSQQTAFKETSGGAITYAGNEGKLDTYIALVRQRQRYQRLRILQHYVDGLSRKSAASTSYLENGHGRGPPLPQLPGEVITTAESGLQASSQAKFKDLVRDLEKSVLRAKLNSKGEMAALKQLKELNPETKRQVWSSGTVPNNAVSLEALGRTRNELIKWVESELSRAGDSDSQAVSQNESTFCARGSIEQLLERIRSQYTRYVEARKVLLGCVSGREPAQLPNTSFTSIEVDHSKESRDGTAPMIQVLSPYLEQLLWVSNEQKAMIQQRSHLTVSLAKQHKEAGQLFDRLADESHLLPAFSLPSSQLPRKIYSKSSPLVNEIPGEELASTAHRARAWAHAAEMSATTTMEAVLISTEEGGLAMEEARQVISDLEKLLGRAIGSVDANFDPGVEESEDIWIIDEKKRLSNNHHRQTKSMFASTDLWASLDGKLGAIGKLIV